jgi:MerR family transcriptional regulator/heat shock protein HspR
MGVERLEDDDYPALTIGQAAELLEVQPAFLRSLDVAEVLQPQRSGGGHRRYSRRQLRRAARMRELFDEGHTLASAAQILALEDELGRVRDERDQARTERDEARTERDQAHWRLDHVRDDATGRRQRSTPHGQPGPGSSGSSAGAG